MKVSLNHVKEYIDFDLPPVDELVTRINERLGGVEEVVDLAATYSGAVIVRVVTCEKHPNADKLSVCLVDDGGVVADVPRNEEGLVQVVCGAPNVHSDMYAVWLPPSATVPASFGEKEPFVLAARELRGVLSQGMLAASDELAIGSDHDGIVEVTDAELPPTGTKNCSELVGASFAAVFGLDDTIIDIENKMFTHRPDLFGQLGVAREIAGIYHQPFTTPEWYHKPPNETTGSGLELEVFNDAPMLVPRAMFVAVKNVQAKPSPLWLRCALVAMGSKSINAIVDATNYLMLLSAQPTHAYDYDKIHGHTIGARMARAGETITLLNGKTYELSEDDIVIADAEGPIGLAGIMGGSATEVDTTTTTIVLEVANFDMYTLRKSSMRHGVFTDALTRFNKGQSPLQNDRVIAKLMELVGELAGGDQASPLHDIRSAAIEDAVQRQTLRADLAVDAQYLNDRLGITLTTKDYAQLLKNVEFMVEDDNNRLMLSAPFWRTDIEQPEDIVEEIGRLYGYDQLPRALPQRAITPALPNETRQLLERLRTALARAGANEVLTYSFVHKTTLISARQDPDDAYQLANALSPELQYYRASLTPSLLDKVHANSKAGYGEFALFEAGRSHSKKAGLNDEGVPFEPRRVALVYASKVLQPGAPYYHAKRLLEYALSSLDLVLEYKPLPAASGLVAAQPFEPSRSARIIDRTSQQAIGIIGEYASSVRKAFKLPEYSAGFELFTEGVLLASRHQGGHYRPLSRYPSVERDVCFEVAHETLYAELETTLREHLAAATAYTATVTPLDIFVGDDAARKRITFRIRLTPEDVTLTSEQANHIIDTVATTVAETLQAIII